MEPLRVSLDWRGEGDRERERQRDKQTERQRLGQTDRQTDRKRERKTQREIPHEKAAKVDQGGGHRLWVHPPPRSTFGLVRLLFYPSAVRLPFSLFRSLSLSLSPSLSLRRLFVFSPSPSLPPRREREEARSQGEKSTRKNKMFLKQKKPRKQHTN